MPWGQGQLGRHLRIKVLVGLAFPDKRSPGVLGGAQAMIESPILDEGEDNPDGSPPG